MAATRDKARMTGKYGDEIWETWGNVGGNVGTGNVGTDGTFPNFSTNGDWRTSRLSPVLCPIRANAAR
jgi:hypothetical protein